MKIGRLEVSGGALMGLALLYYLDREGIFGWVLLVCLLHELGHWGTIRALGGRVTRLRFSCAGAELRLSAAHPLPAWGMVLAALAGPAVNLLLAWGSIYLARNGLGERLYFFAGLNLGLALFNLLPAEWLDGGKALKSILTQLGQEELGEKLGILCSDMVAALLLGAGLILLWESGGRNFTLLIAGVWMAAAARKSERENIA